MGTNDREKPKKNITQQQSSFIYVENIAVM